MIVRQQLVWASKNTTPGRNAMTHITVHETANTARGATAAAHAKLQSSGNARKASWHWQVDDHEAVQSFSDEVICWHAGTTVGNLASIGVEICVNDGGDYQQAVANAAELVRTLMTAHNIPVARVVQHHHWSGKNCPARLRAGTHGITWPGFVALLTPPPARGGATPTTRKAPRMHIITSPAGEQSIVNLSALPPVAGIPNPAESAALAVILARKDQDVIVLDGGQYAAAVRFLRSNT